MSICVEDDEVQDRAMAVAEQLAGGAQQAIRWTKHTLNHWYRAQSAIFDASLAYEFLGFTGPDAREGLASHQEKRPPDSEGPARVRTGHEAAERQRSEHERRTGWRSPTSEGGRSVMARPVWKGSISFGLVNMGVKAFTAVRDHEVHFHQLDKKSGARVRNVKVSGKSGDPLDKDDIEMGYEVKKGKYVTFDRS